MRPCCGGPDVVALLLLENPRFSMLHKSPYMDFCRFALHHRHKPPTPVWETSRFPRPSSTGTCSKLPFSDPLPNPAPAPKTLRRNSICFLLQVYDEIGTSFRLGLLNVS